MAQHGLVKNDPTTQFSKTIGSSKWSPSYGWTPLKVTVTPPMPATKQRRMRLPKAETYQAPWLDCDWPNFPTLRMDTRRKASAVLEASKEFCLEYSALSVAQDLASAGRFDSGKGSFRCLECMT
ncbi:hypothetical protein DPV78_003369 [Talaromyces pinophilus]|nr:hypothetical protein DPV78_003369 [Talaromyces pinophilus]